MTRSKYFIAAFTIAIVAVCLVGAVAFAQSSIGKGLRKPNVLSVFCFGAFFVFPIASAFAGNIFSKLGVHNATWFLLHILAVEIYSLVAGEFSEDEYCIFNGGFVGSYVAILFGGCLYNRFSKPKEMPTSNSFSILLLLLWTAMIAGIIFCEINFEYKLHLETNEVDTIRSFKPTSEFLIQRLLEAAIVAGVYLGVVGVFVMPGIFWIRERQRSGHPRRDSVLSLAAVSSVSIIGLIAIFVGILGNGGVSQNAKWIGNVYLPFAFVRFCRNNDRCA